MTRRKRRRLRVAISLVLRTVWQVGATRFLTTCLVEGCGCEQRPERHYREVFDAAASLRAGTAERRLIGSSRQWWPDRRPSAD